MMYGEAMRSNGKRIAAVFNSMRNIIWREVGYRIINRTLLGEPPVDNLNGRVAGMADGGSGLFSKSCCISPLQVKDLEEKVMD